MGAKIQIQIGDDTFDAELNDTEIAAEIENQLPIQASGNFWGDEIYFSIPVDMDNESPQSEVDVGSLAYWPRGNGFCIFYGPTPASTGDKPRPASPVTVIGKTSADPDKLRNLTDIQNIEITIKE